MTTPAWSAPINGLPGNLRANLGSAHLNQLLGAHAEQVIYTGAGVSTPVHGGQNLQWYEPPANTDISQPFTMSGTTLGRIALPLQPNGNGADVLVTLYPDNGSGAPNTSSPIAATRIPAAYQAQVAATSGLANGGALATGFSNSLFLTGGLTQITWAPPAATINGISTTASTVFDSGYLISVGGQDHVTGSSVPNVYTIYYPGGAALNLPIPQPSLPTGVENNALVICNGALISVGGFASANSAYVFTASWNANTGTIGSWTNQTAYPTAITNPGLASKGQYVYSVGGKAGSSQTQTAAVYMNTVSNGQMGSWAQLNSLPQALSNVGCFVVGNWLISCGGDNASFTTVNNVYYAYINPDGSIGPWQNGPSMTGATGSGGAGGPAAYDVNHPGQMALAGDVIVAFGPYSFIQCLSVTAEGPAPYWRVSDIPVIGNGFDYFYQGALDNGDGSYSLIVNDFQGYVASTTLTPVPLISAPLYATGLTNGATYHVVMQAFQSSTASDYTAFGLINASTIGQAYPSSALKASRFSGTWSAITSGSTVPMQLYDASTTGSAVHVWQEPDAQFKVAQATNAVFYNHLGLLDGVVSITSHPNVPLNSNPTFTSGVSPWTAVNGTITQSSAQTRGGYTFSGLLTPTGGFSLAYATSELFPITQTPWGNAQWVMPTGWFYSPTGWSSFSLSVNWYDSSQAYITTSSATVGLPAATWTQVTNRFQPPATAAYGQLVPTEGGTPGATNLLYMSGVQLLLTPETVGALTSAATVNYGTAAWPPIGVTQLN